MTYSFAHIILLTSFSCFEALRARLATLRGDENGDLMKTVQFDDTLLDSVRCRAPGKPKLNAPILD